MKSVTLASIFGVAVTIALSYLTSWPLALVSGVAAGFFGFRFRGETWPVTRRITKEFWENKWFVLGLLGFCLGCIAAVLGLFWLGGWLNWHRLGDIISYGFLAVMGAAACAALVYVVGYLCHILGLLSCFCVEGSAQLVGQGKWIDERLRGQDCYLDLNFDRPRRKSWPWYAVMILIGLTLPLSFSMLVSLLAIRLTMLIYSQERLIIALSVALGGWAFYAEKWASAQPLTSMIVGLLVGGLAGALQYQLITVPLQKRFAAHHRV